MTAPLFKTTYAQDIYHRSISDTKINIVRKYNTDWNENFKLIDFNKSEDEIYQHVLILIKNKNFLNRKKEFIKHIIVNRWLTLIDLFIEKLIMKKSNIIFYICMYTNDIDYFEKYNQNNTSGTIIYYAGSLFNNKIENELSIYIETNYKLTKKYLVFIFINVVDDDILLLIINKFDISLNDFNFYKLDIIIEKLSCREQHKSLQQLILNTSNISIDIKYLIIKNIEEIENQDPKVIDLYINKYFYDDKYDICNYMINICDNLDTFLYFIENADVKPNLDLIVMYYNVKIVKWMFEQGYRLENSITYQGYTFEILNIIFEYDCLDNNYDNIKRIYQDVCQDIFLQNNKEVGLNIIKKFIELSDAKIIDLHFDSDILLSKAIMHENFDAVRLLLDNNFVLTNKENILHDAKILNKNNIVDFLFNY